MGGKTEGGKEEEDDKIQQLPIFLDFFPCRLYRCLVDNSWSRSYVFAVLLIFLCFPALCIVFTNIFSLMGSFPGAIYFTWSYVFLTKRSGKIHLVP